MHPRTTQQRHFLQAAAQYLQALDAKGLAQAWQAHGPDRPAMVLVVGALLFGKNPNGLFGDDVPWLNDTPTHMTGGHIALLQVIMNQPKAIILCGGLLGAHPQADELLQALLPQMDADLILDMGTHAKAGGRWIEVLHAALMQRPVTLAQSHRWVEVVAKKGDEAVLTEVLPWVHDDPVAHMKALASAIRAGQLQAVQQVMAARRGPPMGVAPLRIAAEANQPAIVALLATQMSATDAILAYLPLCPAIVRADPSNREAAMQRQAMDLLWTHVHDKDRNRVLMLMGCWVPRWVAEVAAEGVQAAVDAIPVNPSVRPRVRL